MRKTFVVSLMILLGLSGTAAQAADANTGLRLYENGQYLSAYNEFNQLAKVDINNPEVHYLLAITMVKMGDPNGATNEYQRTMALDPHGTYGQQARVGLGELASNPALPPSGNIDTVGEAMSAIRQQAHIEKHLKSSDTQANVRNINETTTGTASNLQKSRDAVVQDMESSTIITRHGYTIPMYSEDQINDVQAQYNNQISNVRSVGSTEAAKAQANGAQSVDALRDSVHNLYSQLQNPGSTGVKLIPQGTNLYVRNYASN